MKKQKHVACRVHLSNNSKDKNGEPLPGSYDPVRAFIEERAELTRVVALESALDVADRVACGRFDKAVVDNVGDTGLFLRGFFCKDLCGPDAEDEHLEAQKVYNRMER